MFAIALFVVRVLDTFPPHVHVVGDGDVTDLKVVAVEGIVFGCCCC